MVEWHEFRWLDLATQVLDRQIVDPDENSLGKVDDLELRERDDGRIEVVELLLGDRVLAGRLEHMSRRLMSQFLRLIGESGEPRRIPITAVLRAAPAIMVTRSAAKFAVSPVEERLRRSVIARIPGSGHASV